MVDSLSPTHIDESLTQVQQTNENDTEIQGGSNAFFSAIAETIINNKGQEVTPENVKELADAIKGVIESSNAGLISSLNTGDVSGLTTEELNVALDGVFTSYTRMNVTREGIESAALVFENLGIAKEDLSLEAQVAMSGIMTQIQTYVQRSLNLSSPESHNAIPQTPTPPGGLNETLQPNEPTCDDIRQTLPLGSNKSCFDI